MLFALICLSICTQKYGRGWYWQLLKCAKCTFFSGHFPNLVGIHTPFLAEDLCLSQATVAWFVAEWGKDFFSVEQSHAVSLLATLCLATLDWLCQNLHHANGFAFPYLAEIFTAWCAILSDTLFKTEMDLPSRIGAISTLPCLEPSRAMLQEKMQLGRFPFEMHQF